MTYQRYGATRPYAAGVGELHDVRGEFVEIGSVAQDSLARRKREGGGRTYKGNQLTLFEKRRVVREIESVKAYFVALGIVEC